MDRDEMLKELGLKAMIALSDEEMDGLVEDYEIFMKHVAVLEQIDTSDVEPLAYPYEIETTFLREDIDNDRLSREDALKNAKDILDNQIKVPKVV